MATAMSFPAAYDMFSGLHDKFMSKRLDVTKKVHIFAPQLHNNLFSDRNKYGFRRIDAISLYC